MTGFSIFNRTSFSHDSALVVFMYKFVIAGSLVALSGCNQESVTQNRPRSAMSDSEKQAKSNALVRNALQLLTTEKTTLNDPDFKRFQRVRSLLNQWLRQTGVANDIQLSDSSQEILNRSIHSDELKQHLPKLFANQFSPHDDAQHLNATMFFADIAQHAQAGHSDPLSQAKSIFDWVVRTVQLIPSENPDHISLVQYRSSNDLTLRMLAEDILILGRGTHIERAYLSVLLLRQLKIEACLIGSQNPENDRFDLRWLGILINRDIFLFDPVLGLPVTNLQNRDLASLKQFSETPDAFTSKWGPRQTKGTSIPSDSLDSLTIKLAFDPLYWAPRMKVLEDKLTSMSGPIVLYEEIGSITDVNGDHQLSLPDRLIEAAGQRFSNLSIDLIDIPKMIESSVAPKSSRDSEVPLVLQPFSFGGGSLRNARLSQLRGQFMDAIKQYQELLQAITSAGDFRGSDAYFAQRAKEMSHYWTGVCIFEKGNYGVANDTWFQLHLTHFPDSPWTHAIWYFIGRCNESLSQKPSDPLQQERYRNIAIESYLKSSGPQKIGNDLRADLLTP